jgi:hypothetical protein
MRVLGMKVRQDRLRLQPDKSALQCLGDRHRAVGDTQLAKDVDEVRFDRCLADVQATGDIAGAGFKLLTDQGEGIRHPRWNSLLMLRMGRSYWPIRSFYFQAVSKADRHRLFFFKWIA